MSSEPTQPVPEWWQQPQGPKKDDGPQRDRLLPLPLATPHLAIRYLAPKESAFAQA